MHGIAAFADADFAIRPKLSRKVRMLHRRPRVAADPDAPLWGASSCLPCFGAAAYLPQHFKPDDFALALNLIEDHPLALALGPDAQGQSFGSHLLLIAKADGETLMLEGHMARANPHWGFGCPAQSSCWPSSVAQALT